jgi:hypothetical protein
MGSAIIEVGIGLVLIYLVLSIVVTQINNTVVNVLNLRAENLREWFRDVITDASVRQELLSHPMINIVKTQAQVEAQKASENRFMRFFKGIGRWMVGMLVPGASDLRYTSKVSYVDPQTFANVLLSILVEDQRQFVNVPEEDKVKALIAALRARVGDSPLEKPFEETLETVLKTATSLQDAQAKLEAWFNGAMNNLSDTFKRRVKTISFIVGLLVAVILNVDTLHVAKTLWNDSTLRESIAVYAERQVRTIDLNEQLGNSGSVNEESAKVQSNVQALLDLRLPIGWHGIDITPENDSPETQALAFDDKRNINNFSPAYSGDTGTWFGFLAYKIGGWLLTTLAIMQGADFWFNLLRQLSAARSGSTSTTTSPAGTTTTTTTSSGGASSGGVG